MLLKKTDSINLVELGALTLLCVAVFVCFPTSVSAAGAKSGKSSSPKRESYEEILKKYMFVADFAQKEPTRAVSDEIFWQYPFAPITPEFPILAEFDDIKRELPATSGSGRDMQHLNRGRALFLEGKYKEARTSWLSARARYGKESPAHRRNDYFIGLSFLKQAQVELNLSSASPETVYNDTKVQNEFSNATVFYSWAFLVKKNVPDSLVDDLTPKGLYNLAAIYFRYQRWAGAYGAAEEGMNFLRKTGRKEFRTQFRRILAESHITNRSYLEAFQELDAALRQDQDKPQAGAIFARAGDIYFSFNNYELAEDAYRVGGLIDEELRNVSPMQMVLRGESLFWLGKFADAQRLLHFALNGIPFRKDVKQLPSDMTSWAKLRFADAWMAQKKYDDAKLAYFQVEHDFRGTEAARIAGIRRACLELPFYLGRNVEHARNMLEGYKAPPPEKSVPDQATELAWACFTSSYSERERTKAMVERVREFADKFPESRFLRSMATPVRAVQAGIIDELFAAGNPYAALSFFEKNRKVLFPKVADDLAKKLFVSYVQAFQSAKAGEFWASYDKEPESDTKLIRQAVVAAEMVDLEVLKNNKKKSKVDTWRNRSEAVAAKLAKRNWSVKADQEILDYIARIRASNEGQIRHLQWIFSLALFWGQTDAALACELEYPLLVQITDRSPKLLTSAQFAGHIQSLVKRTLPGAIDADESCAASILDLEAGLIKDKPKDIAAVYMARRDWPMKPAFVNQLWLAAEKLHEAGDKAGARELWQILVTRAPKDMPESVFAKSRLDPNRTEFENLWN